MPLTFGGNAMTLRALALATLSAAALTTLAPAAAQDASDPTGASAQGDLSVTIYNNGQSLVQDIRQLNIARGQSTISFPDVSAMIRPETLSFSAADTAILEQNFDFDLLTPQKLMEKAVGQTVTLIRTNPATGQETMQRAEVLSTAGGVVIRVNGKVEVLRDDGLPVRVIFDEVPSNLRARPTLSVMVDSDRAGSRPASIRYLTPGLGWSADYVALFDQKSGKLDMQGWVTLTNTTGTTFTQADTLLVAGNVGGRGYAQPRGDMLRPSTRSQPNSRNNRPGTETPDRERLGDYYLYPIEGRTTIANNQTKQVSFLDVQGVPARRTYVIASDWLQSDEDFRSAATGISFSSSREGGLGDALPAGTVRFYERDSQGNPQFIGENGLGHTPMGSQLTLRTGDAFDVKMKAEVEKREKITAADYERSARYRVIVDGEVVKEVEVDRSVDYYRTTMRYTFTNAKPEPVEVELQQRGLGGWWWASDYRVVSEDVKGEQLNASNRVYNVTVPANSEREVRVTYETKF